VYVCARLPLALSGQAPPGRRRAPRLGRNSELLLLGVFVVGLVVSVLLLLPLRPPPPPLLPKKRQWQGSSGGCC
jgi:hypothetical protein